VSDETSRSLERTISGVDLRKQAGDLEPLAAEIEGIHVVADRARDDRVSGLGSPVGADSLALDRAMGEGAEGAG